MTDEYGRPSPRIAGKRRFFIFAVFFSLASFAVLLRYGYLMLLPHESSRASAKTEEFIGRGPILDRNGRLLALETRLGNIGVRRQDIKDAEKAMEEAL